MSISAKLILILMSGFRDVFLSRYKQCPMMAMFLADQFVLAILVEGHLVIISFQL